MKSVRANAVSEEKPKEKNRSGLVFDAGINKYVNPECTEVLPAVFIRSLQHFQAEADQLMRLKSASDLSVSLF